MNSLKNNKQRIVVKVGTSTLTHDNGNLNFRNLEALTRVLSDIKNKGCEVVLVTSGAIGIGIAKLGMAQKPTALPYKQAVAAVGQCELMHLYDKIFAEYGHTVGQILLTRQDVDQKARRQNLINTFQSLLELGVIPIVNENDSVCFEEIESGKNKVFGDNDTLSAMVAALCQADLLVFFSDINGLYDSDPRENPQAVLIPEVLEINDDLRSFGGGAGTNRGTGGMVTKISAAEIAMKNGIDMVITNGSHPETLYDILDGKPVGTLFRAPKKQIGGLSL